MVERSVANRGQRGFKSPALGPAVAALQHMGLTAQNNPRTHALMARSKQGTGTIRPAARSYPKPNCRALIARSAFGVYEANNTPNAVRSPSYPNMSLREAIAEVAKIEAQYRAAPVDRMVAAKIIGYSGLSGPANKALAALAQFGLVERAGKGHLRVSDRARAILHSNSDAEKLDNLRWAAAEPPLFRELTERFPGITPPEDGVVTHLNRQGFNLSAVKPAAKAYLETLLYLREVGASESHGNQSSDASNSKQPDEDGPEKRFGGARVGDLVQWEINGVLQMEAPMKVRLATEDGKWIAVEGSETGIPMEEVIVEERGSERAPPPSFALKPRDEEESTLGEGWLEERLIDDAGEKIFIRYRGEATADRYRYIRDYLDFKLGRMSK